jgi:hypothetical protein
VICRGARRRTFGKGRECVSRCSGRDRPGWGDLYSRRGRLLALDHVEC